MDTSIFKNNNYIFVSIASYRDPQCSTTVRDLYDKAEYPENVFVGICSQNKTDTEDETMYQEEECLNDPDFKYKKNIRIIRLDYTQAKGPTFARYLCSTLWLGEKWFMQVDSHTLFVKNWDTKSINMINKLIDSGVKKPVISYYPGSIEDTDEAINNEESIPIQDQQVPRVCKHFFNERGLVSYLGSEHVRYTPLPYPTPFITGGYIFCDSLFLKELPFDPTLDYLFIGEELLHSARFYTHGWDIFSPNQHICFHEYTRAEKPKIWSDLTYSDNEATDRVKEMLQLKEKTDTEVSSLLKYGLGNIRSLKDFYDYAGIDVENQRTTKNFCRYDNKLDEGDDGTYDNKPETQETTVYSKEYYGDGNIYHPIIIFISIVLIASVVYILNIK